MKLIGRFCSKLEYYPSKVCPKSMSQNFITSLDIRRLSPSLLWDNDYVRLDTPLPNFVFKLCWVCCSCGLILHFILSQILFFVCPTMMMYSEKMDVLITLRHILWRINRQAVAFVCLKWGASTNKPALREGQTIFFWLWDSILLHWHNLSVLK